MVTGFPVNTPEDIIRGIREYPDLTVWELCPECEAEVEIPAYGRSVCPECGAPILPCSMCGRCTEPCVYEALCYNPVIHPELKEICYRGRCMDDKKWSEETGIPRSTLRNRILSGWPLEKAFDTRKFSYGTVRPGTKRQRYTAHAPDDWKDQRSIRTVSEWSRVTGIPTYVLYQRLKDGLTMAQAIEKPYRPRVHRRLYETGGVSMSLTEWARELGMPPGVLRQRLNSGKTFEEAVSMPYVPAKERRRHMGPVVASNRKPRFLGWFRRFRR